MNPEAVFFDFDGVICDSVDIKTRSFDRLYENHDDDIRQMVRSYHLEHGGISRYEKIRHFETVINGKPPGQALVDSKAALFANLVREAVIASPYIPGAMETLNKLHTVCDLFVVSGTPEGELRLIVEKRGLAQKFHGVFGAPRTKGDILQSILDEFGFNPSRTVMIGDAMTDYQAAREVGVPFIGVVGGGEGAIFPSGTRQFVDLRGIADEILGV